LINAVRSCLRHVLEPYDSRRASRKCGLYGFCGMKSGQGTGALQKSRVATYRTKSALNAVSSFGV